uniref:Uncharacterized protein n=1 Tax=Arundo donax TaxID=35708 RepID=A0A0A8YG03_ARUDO
MISCYLLVLNIISFMFFTKLPR